MGEDILKEFDAKEDLFFRITGKATSLICELLDEYGVSVHSVTSRTKKRKSLAQKLSRSDRKYGALDDITDIVGVRITTYFEEDVDRVVSVLEKEFDVDQHNSIDKRSILDPDRFGYMSTHHVVRLNALRRQFPEYQRFGNQCFEIQTRSILQHAWAEIEHDLGYKSEIEIPKEIRRRFSRLAGLLELADIEFNAIRNELTEYDAGILSKIQSKPNEIEINKNSLRAFVNTSSVIKQLDEAIVANSNYYLAEKDDAIAVYSERLVNAGIKTIAELEHSLIKYRGLIRKFAEVWIGKDKPTYKMEMSHGLSIFYLLYIILASRGDKQSIIDYFLKYDVEEDAAVKTAQRVLDTYDALA